MPTEATPILLMKGISKRFPGVQALSSVDFRLLPGEVHAVMGQNGAGKSTLIKVMTGVYPADAGTIELEGRPIAPSGPLEAQRLGIATVYQEVNLCPNLSVAENVMLGRDASEAWAIHWKSMNQRAEELLAELHVHVDVTAPLSTYSIALQQMCAIARALAAKARILILDEPTSSLSEDEVSQLFTVIRRLKAQGMAVLFITHFLDQVFQISDRITVLRDGKHVVTDETRNFDRARIVKAMVGRDMSQTVYGRRKDTVRPRGERVLSVQNLRMAPMVKNNSFSIFAGQITGIFGLVGAGRTETFKVVSGVLKRDFFHGGEILLHGKPVRFRVPAPAVHAGVAYVTEDRKVEGFFETMSIARNIYMGLLAKLGSKRPFFLRREAASVGESWVKKLNVRAISKDVKVIELSGGNQQKVVIAKSLAQEPELIVFDEPTRGVDVGAIAEIHQLLNRLADEGKAVVMISSYLPEILALSDRILVSRQGKVVEEFSALEATEEKIMYAAIH
jgi:simple sugar transport system ATP-binding protein